MKRIFNILILLFVASFTTVACGKKEESLVAPEIIGVVSEKEIYVNEEFNVLTGIKGFEDNKDVTTNIVVTTNPSIPIVNGVVTPTESGTYSIIYSLTHSKDKNLKASEVLFLEVLPVTIIHEDKELEIDFKFVEHDLQGFSSLDTELFVVANDLIVIVEDEATVSKTLTLNPIIDHNFHLRLQSNEEIDFIFDLLDSNNNSLLINPFDHHMIEEFLLAFTLNATGLDEVTMKITFIGNADVKINEFSLGFLNLVDESSISYDLFTHLSLNDETNLTINENNIIVKVNEGHDNILNEGLYFDDVQLFADEDYVLTFTINTNKEFTFLLTGILGLGIEENSFFSKEMLVDQLNENVEVEILFTGLDYTGASLLLGFEFGLVEDGTIFTLSNMNLVGKHALEFVEDSVYFDGNFGFKVAHEDIGDGVLIHSELSDELVYEVVSFGPESFHNTVYYDNYLVKAESGYVFEIEIKATEDIEFDFIILDKIYTENIKSEKISLTDEYQVITLQLDDLISYDGAIQILLQFGNNDFGETAIYIKNFTITRIHESNN